MLTYRASGSPRPLWFLTAVSTILVAASVLVYSPGLDGGFVFDDLPSIVDNQRLHIDRIDLASLDQAARSFEPGSRLQARPLSMASLGINHAVGGLDPRGYKAVGIGIHAANSMLIFLLALQLLRLARPGRDPVFAAMAIAAGWALHPLQVSTVLYVVQRMESISLLFVLAALLCYVEGRVRQSDGKSGWPWIALCVPLGLAGVAAKESAVLLPVYALAIEATLLRFRAASPGLQRAWRFAYGGAVLLTLVGFLAVFVPRYWVESDPIVRGFGSAERLMTQFRILPMYLGQMFWPMPSTMTFYYDQLAPSRGWLQPSTTLGGAAIIASLALGAVLVRNRLPLFTLGIALFFGSHLLTSNIVPLEIAFEHRNYFALFGVLLSFASLVQVLPPREHLAYKRLVVGALVAMCAFMTLLRASVWGDPLLFATENVSYNPRSSRASVDLGAEYLEMTDGYAASPFFDFAMREFDRGADIPGSSIISDQGLILAAIKAGRPVEDKWWNRLHQKLRQGNITPETTQALFGLLRNRLNGVELDDRRLVDAFLILFDRVAMPPYSYGQVADYVMSHTGDEALAEQLYARAVSASSADPEYVRRVVEMLRKDGHQHSADTVLDQAHAQGMLLDMSIARPSPASPE